MLRNKLKILISSVLIATTLFAGFTFLKRPAEAPKQINRIENNEQKIDYSESIIEKLESIIGSKINFDMSKRIKELIWYEIFSNRRLRFYR